MCFLTLVQHIISNFNKFNILQKNDRQSNYILTILNYIKPKK